MDFNVFTEFNKFADVQLVTDGKWKNLQLNGQRLASGTSIISKYKYPFDPDGEVAARVAAREGVEPEVIKAKWAHKGLISTEKGNALHQYIEDAYASRQAVYPDARIRSTFPDELDPVKENYDIIKAQFEDFKHRTRTKLVPIKSEFIVADEELKIGGIIDQLFYNTSEDELQIWDWKTNNGMSKGDPDHSFFKAPMDNIPLTKENEYFIQLSIYKYIIEKNTNLKVGNCYIGWFYEDNDVFKIIKAPYFKEVGAMIEHYNQNHAYGRGR